MLYFDHAATAFPKAPGVLEAMTAYISQVGATVNRGSYAPAQAAGAVTLEARQRLCRLFGLSDPRRAIFTPGLTWSLNMALKGALRAGDHCVVGSLAHNAVMRPLGQLAFLGVTVTRIPADRAGRLDIGAFENALKPSTRLVAVSHASNVSGTLQPMEEIAGICRKRGVFLLVDAAQTAGRVPIHMEQMGIDALCLPGHKGLLGPQGIGGLLLSEAFAGALSPIVSGGTGSLSDSEEVPPFLPDRFEPGTPNLPGIYGLEAALRFLEEAGPETLYAHEMALTKSFLMGVSGLAHVRTVGPADAKEQVGVVSLDFLRRDNAEVASALEERHKILVRSGMHCAPNAHKTLGTYPQGTVRFSFGYTNTPEEVAAAVEAVRALE